MLSYTAVAVKLRVQVLSALVPVSVDKLADAILDVDATERGHGSDHAAVPCTHPCTHLARNDGHPGLPDPRNHAGSRSTPSP
jgi:hypothetical protein